MGEGLFFRQYQEFIAEHTTKFMGMVVERAQKCGSGQNFLGALVTAVRFKLNQAVVFKLSDFVAQSAFAQILVVINAL